MLFRSPFDQNNAFLGLQEMLEEGVVLVEWADRAEDVLPRPRWEVRISPTGQMARTFRVSRVR